ncbi:MAG: AzlD domain-containing protein [Chloroflexi bacterium]|nr:AzlD domain-containing protein [Chloroflexota bacterium]MCI0580627.1 AzlD domain-containing protein [Chloroflexota bacterium]MCI0647639.1 AzlD domain-containing protein [Chloroflexota bacterium]
MTLWLTLLAIGLCTYAIRLSFILLFGRLEVPPLVQRALRFVPPAVLAAIIFPDVLMPNGVLDFSPGNPRLVAGALAVIVAWRTRNALLTIAVGMAALLLLGSI